MIRMKDVKGSIAEYDNGQIQLTRIITSVFNSLLSNVEI